MDVDQAAVVLKRVVTQVVRVKPDLVEWRHISAVRRIPALHVVLSFQLLHWVVILLLRGQSLHLLTYTVHVDLQAALLGQLVRQPLQVDLVFVHLLLHFGDFVLVHFDLFVQRLVLDLVAAQLVLLNEKLLLKLLKLSGQMLSVHSLLLNLMPKRLLVAHGLVDERGRRLGPVRVLEVLDGAFDELEQQRSFIALNHGLV